MTLAEYLSETGTTETAFALSLGVSQVTVHRYVKGTRFPDRDTILRIEDTTDGKVCPADWYTSEPADSIGGLRLADAASGVES